MAAIKTMGSAAALTLGVLSLIFLIVAMATNEWVNENDGKTSSGLWKSCDNVTCDDVLIGKSKKYFHYEMVRGFGVCGAAMGALAVGLGVIAVLKKSDSISPSVIATSYFVEAFFVVTAVALFTALRLQSRLEAEKTEGFGYSFVLGWIAAPCSVFAASIMYFLEWKA